MVPDLLGNITPSLRWARTLLVLAAAVLSLGVVPAAASALSSGTAGAKSPSHDAERSAGRVRGSRPGGVSGVRRLRSIVLLVPGADYGARGSMLVRVLQLRLVEVGAGVGVIDGRYGRLTERAVARFQAAHGLVVDGIAGPVTLAALTAPIPTLYPGAGYQQAGGSIEVRELQHRLAGAGFAPGPIDGRDGPLTTRAVERFQRVHRLHVDGIVGVHSWHALRTAGGHPSAARRPQKHEQPVPEGQPAPKGGPEQRHVPGLPVTLLLLGLTALGLATISVSYSRARVRMRRARANTRPQVKPMPLALGWGALSGSRGAEHEERER
jgi:Putative peptidoglycan binding domain